MNGATAGQKSRFQYYVIKWKKWKEEEPSLFQQTWKRKQHMAQSQWSQWKPFGWLQWILDKAKVCEQVNVTMHGYYLVPHFISMRKCWSLVVSAVNCCLMFLEFIAKEKNGGDYLPGQVSWNFFFFLILLSMRKWGFVMGKYFSNCAGGFLCMGGGIWCGVLLEESVLSKWGHFQEHCCALRNLKNRNCVSCWVGSFCKLYSRSSRGRFRDLKTMW